MSGSATRVTTSECTVMGRALRSTSMPFRARS